MANARTVSLRERLAKAGAYLERLDAERFSGGNPALGSAIEKRIVWRELLELELQNFDEQIQQLKDGAQKRLSDTENGLPS